MTVSIERNNKTNFLFCKRSSSKMGIGFLYPFKFLIEGHEYSVHTLTPEQMPTKQILNVLLNTKANTQFGRKQILILLLNTKTNSQLPKQMLKFEQKRILNFYKSSDTVRSQSKRISFISHEVNFCIWYKFSVTSCSKFVG